MENNEEILEELDEEVEVLQQDEKVEELSETEEEKPKEKPNLEAASLQEKTNKKRNKLQTIGIIFLVLGILVILVSIVYILLFSNNNTKTKKEKVTAKNQEYYSQYQLKGNSLEDFDLYFMKLENKEKNKVYSPLSIKYALEMLAEGSNGDTKAQIDAVIGEYVARKYSNSSHMSFANAMFIRNSFKDEIKESYTNLLQEKYNANVLYDNFENAKTINNWISEKTFNLINNLLDDEAVQQGNFYLVNALAIDMNWKNQIQCQAGNLPCKYYHVYYPHEEYNDYVANIETVEDYPALTFDGKENRKAVQIGASFNNYDIVRELGEENIRKTVGDAYRDWLQGDEVKRMEEDAKKWNYNANIEYDVDKFLDNYIKEIDSNYRKEDISSDYSFYVNDDVKVFAKDLQEENGITLQYVGIMPKNIPLQEFIKDTTATQLSNIISNLKELESASFREGVVTKITGYIPLFQFDYSLDLINDLKELGIKDVFESDKANLSNMTDDKQYIYDALHQANIEFSNEGIKATAVTAGGGAGSASGGFDYKYEVPVETINLTFDNPYMFLIRDKETGEVWFAGTVYEPIKK